MKIRLKIEDNYDQFDINVEFEKEYIEEYWALYVSADDDDKSARFNKDQYYVYDFDNFEYKFTRVFFRNYINLKNSIEPFLK